MVVDPHSETLAALQRALERLPHAVIAVLLTSATESARQARQTLVDWLEHRGGRAALQQDTQVLPIGTESLVRVVHLGGVLGHAVLEGVALPPSESIRLGQTG